MKLNIHLISIITYHIFFLIHHLAFDKVKWVGVWAGLRCIGLCGGPMISACACLTSLTSESPPCLHFIFITLYFLWHNSNLYTNKAVNTSPFTQGESNYHGTMVAVWGMISLSLSLSVSCQMSPFPLFTFPGETIVTYI